MTENTDENIDIKEDEIFESKRKKFFRKKQKKSNDKIVFIYIIIKSQESKHLLDVMKKTIEINNYDFKKMMKDFEIEDRFQNNNKKLKKKWDEEIEQMKEFREHSFRQKNSELLKKLNKKENILITSLENSKLDKKKEKKKIIAQMMKKKKIAKENVKNFMKEQEKLRFNLEKETNLKCN